MIYLNNAATSFPKPKEVVDAVNLYLASMPVNPSRSGFETQNEDVILSCRRKLAAFFHAKEPDRIIFTSGATESLNFALYGLNFNGDHVVTTAIEHTSVLRPLKTMEKEGLVELAIVDCDSNGYVNPKDIASAIKKNTRAVVVNHCSNVTGEILDLKSISEIAHKNGSLLIVDASQSAGNIPINVTTDKIDILAFTGHKSLYGLPGIGGVYISEGIKLKPLKVGGTGSRSELLYQPQELPLYYESGTHNLPGIASLAAGIDFIQETGIDKIKQTKQQQLKKLTVELKKIPEIIIYGDENIENRSSVFCFNMGKVPPADLGYILESSFDIVVRAGLHCAPLIHKAMRVFPQGTIRISPSYFTTSEEIEYLIKAIKEISTNIQFYENY